MKLKEIKFIKEKHTNGYTIFIGDEEMGSTYPFTDEDIDEYDMNPECTEYSSDEEFIKNAKYTRWCLAPPNDIIIGEIIFRHYDDMLFPENLYELKEIIKLCLEDHYNKYFEK